MTMTEADVVAGYAAKQATPLDDQPRNVVAALARVLAEIGGIDKMTAQQRAVRGMGGGDTGISYAYRGIDQIAGAAQPLLGRYGVVIVPTIEESRVEQITVNNRPWTDTWVRVHWGIYGPGGTDDFISAVTEGLGRDNADKGHNKAMTSAAKNLLLRLLMIGDSSDDSDGHTYERDKVEDVPPGEKQLSPATFDDFKTKCEQAGIDAEVVLWSAFGNNRPDPLLVKHLPEMRDAFDRVKQAQEAPELAGPAPELPFTPQPVEVRPVTNPQVAKIKAEYQRLGIARDAQIEFAGLLLGHDIVSHTQITYDEAERLIDALTKKDKE